MLSGKKTPRHQTREYRRLLRPQKDLRAFFGPLAVTIGVLSLVALAVGGAYTTGRRGVLPQYETSAVRQPASPLLASRPLLSPCPFALTHLLRSSSSECPVSLQGGVSVVTHGVTCRATIICCSTLKTRIGSLQVRWEVSRSSTFTRMVCRCDRALVRRCCGGWRMELELKRGQSTGEAWPRRMCSIGDKRGYRVGSPV
jgi:hypothetical protein